MLESPARQRILVAMSGGVDSSVAAALLHEQGHDLIGVTLHLWDASGEEQVGRCCAPEDRDDARRTCEALGIPHYVLDEREAFRRHVVDPFLDEYAAGRTPIPCVQCNRTVKLVHLAELAGRFGATHVATGHYARTVQDGGRTRLLRGVDHGKDQSYFLFGLPQQTLARMIFPLGERIKDETRAEGRRLGVPNADKPDSQELCFVPDGDIRGFVSRQRGGTASGTFVDEQGTRLGTHEGIEGFTVGQRKGLGMGGGSEKPRYVLRILPDQRQVVLGDEAALGSRSLVVTDAAWVAGAMPDGPFDASVRVRYRHDPAPARITPTAAGFRADFASPQRAITPGQAAVVYVGDEVVGGGFITEERVPAQQHALV
ncbi:MAG: tRNA 2-thiouridine(34) synthase MnmA [Sandaracinaceae bacterium]|nr:tRNA 2-thiouridine(34) synthase MnmA [Sandaracinaceae bacterium]